MDKGGIWVSVLGVGLFGENPPTRKTMAKNISRGFLWVLGAGSGDSVEEAGLEVG